MSVAVAVLAPAYAPRCPTETVLYSLVRQHLESFLAHAREHYESGLPRYVEQELRAYLKCGVFSEGLTRCHCDTCGHDLLVAFSCHGRTICPSCTGRRTANGAAHLVDRVLPDVPVRQYVLSLPFELRRLAALKADVPTALARIFVEATFATYRARAKRAQHWDGGEGNLKAMAKSSCPRRLAGYDRAVRLAPRWAACIIATIGLAACSSSNGQSSGDSLDGACPGISQQGLVNGSTQESFLGLGQEQVRAMVQVDDALDAPDAGGALCSGVFVTAEWVMTAQHCLQIASPEVTTAGQGQEPPIHLPVSRSVGHPSEDVALLQVDAITSPDASASEGIVGMSPIPVGGAGVGRLAPGTAVEMAGYGLTENWNVGDLRFLVEAITAIDAASITVSGFGASGGCEGDSGGPLLMRGVDGGVEVAGILSTGSATCREDDTYVRVDTIRDWIQAITGPYVPSNAGCGGIAPEGRCLYGSALWCSGEQLSAEACTGGESCGWDRAQTGYRCVPSGSDPCQGVDSIGVCDAGSARWCNRGTLTSESCGCTPCRVDGMSGKPFCGG